MNWFLLFKKGIIMEEGERLLNGFKFKVKYNGFIFFEDKKLGWVWGVCVIMIRCERVIFICKMLIWRNKSFWNYV